jgi:hypothetical protein
MAAPGEAALGFVVVDPVQGVIARKALRPPDELRAATGELRIGDALLSDGDAAYCYNTETASIRLHLYERAPRVGGWAHGAAFRATGRAQFEYAQRTPVPGQELHLR